MHVLGPATEFDKAASSFNLLKMVLAGQKPEVIMEICSRALAFWTYQVRNMNY